MARSEVPDGPYARMPYLDRPALGDPAPFALNAQMAPIVVAHPTVTTIFAFGDNIGSTVVS